MSVFRVLALALFLSLCACSSGGGAPAESDTDLASLSDEFADAATLADWQRVFVVEQWGFDQLESFGIGTDRAGWLTMTPYASSWFQDYRGVLAFKPIVGDFVVTARVEASNRLGTGAPGSDYSLAGIMVRAPRNVTPATWQRGGENYVFLSLGAASNAGTFQTEVKTTIDSVSTIEIDDAPGGLATIRVARLGAHVIALIRFDGGMWQVHRRYLRADLPAGLQVGLTTYTDWNTVSPLTPEEHNVTLLTGGNPDLVALFDYVRYAAPVVPPGLVGRDFSNPADVSDGELLAFLAFN